MKQYNIGLATLVEFLNQKGANVEMNPNTKVSDEYIQDLDKKFGEEKKAKEDSEKVKIKIKEIIEGTKKKPEEEEEVTEDEIIIRDNSIAPEETASDNNADKAEAEKAAKEAKEAAKAAEEAARTAEAEAKRAAEAEAAAKAAAEAAKIAEASKVEEEAKAAEAAKEVKAAEAAKEVKAAEAAKEVKAAEAAKEVKAAETKKATEAEQSAKISSEATKANEASSTEDKAHKNNGKKGHKKDEGPVPTPAGNVKSGKPAKKVVIEKDDDEPVIQGPKVLGKIDFSQFDRKKNDKNKKKRERISKDGSQKVDVTKVDGENNNNNNSKKNKKNRNNNNRDNNKGGRGQKNDRFNKPAMTEAEEEEMQKEIQKQIKETYARMNETKSKNFGAKHRRDRRELERQKMQEEQEQQAEEQKILKVTEFVTVNDLATLMNNTPVTKVIGACMSLGLMVSINQRLDAEALVLVAEEFGYQVEFVTADLTEQVEQEEEDKPEDYISRPPIITVMGHVDHGKTSLLDFIRKANVIAGEAGGITQHIGAYNVKMPDGKRITFLDTPGHEAFTAMRARGAKMTDIAIIIIAADDAIMPQTVEAINHAQAAGVPMVFAINKIDKPGANPEKIKEQLSQMNILVEDWGGNYQCQEISAKKGLNVDKLLEKVLLEAELLDLKANPKRKGSGAVIESSLDKGRGYLATVLVQNGTMRVGDVILSGSYTGRIKAMFNERGQNVEEAGPSTPVSILGLNGAPTAGETINVMEDEKEARNIANKREQLIRIQGIKTQKHMTLEEIGRRIAIGNFKELNIIVKGDVDGSVEALSDSLIKLSTEEVRVNVIHKAVGAISESDVLLATASDAIIIGFQVRPMPNARKLAEQEEIEIRLYSVIYDCINELKSGIEGMLEPETKEEVTATAEVMETFKISKVGTIAGAMVREGKLLRTSKVRVIRDGIVVYTGELGSLKRFKDDVKEVVSGMDCGLNIANYNDIKVGDIVEAYNIVEIKRKL